MGSMMNIYIRKLNNLEEDKFTVVSLFSGAGGLDMGFSKEGFDVVWANDNNMDSCETHKLWSNATVVYGDISKIDFNTIPKSDIITGGFPCQGFSLAGPRKIDDSRNTLYKHFVKLVEEKQPYAFVAENVKGILTLGGGTIIEAIKQDFSDKGYDVFINLVNASDYGVPQDRNRVIIMGFRKDLKVENYYFPKPFETKKTIKDVLQGVPEPSNDEVNNGAYSSRYMSRNRRREWDKQSYSIVAMAKQIPLHPSSPKMIKVSPTEWKFGEGETRRFSYQEAAALQTFPRDMEFIGNLTSKYKQIGNAVPVQLARVVASEVKRVLNEKMEERDN